MQCKLLNVITLGSHSINQMEAISKKRERKRERERERMGEKVRVKERRSDTVEIA